MKLWEKVKEIEQDGEGYGIKGEITRDRLVQIRCPGMYRYKGLTDYHDDRYTNCQDFSADNDYVPCYVCWEREFESKVGE